jgi:hypothetical protein
MTGAWRALRRFWESDPGLSVFLGLLVVLRWGPFSAPATAGAALVTVVAMTFVVLVQAFREGPINVHRIQDGSGPEARPTGSRGVPTCRGRSRRAAP